MVTQLSIFDRYPSSPGHQASDTSRAAAKSVKPRAATLRNLCLQMLRKAELTADEVAAQICESVLGVRPRIAELNKQGLIVDTGKRRKNASGESAKVWGAK